MGKKALLIGVNRYRIPGADLRGCVNDVNNLSAVLVEFYGFRKVDIAVLTDEKATKTAMQTGIRALVTGGRKGDVLLLHYSGHGANVPDKNGDEADQRDEILCPHDLDWKDPLTDDWLRTTFNRCATGVSLTVIMDCCHSGTNTRALAAAGCTDDSALPAQSVGHHGRGVRAQAAGQGARRVCAPRPPRRARSRTSSTADIPEVLITGCRDTQTSADAYIGGSFNGALTYALTKVLREAKGKISYRDLHARTLSRLKREDFDQVPQLEGRKDNLDRRFLAPMI